MVGVLISSTLIGDRQPSNGSYFFPSFILESNRDSQVYRIRLARVRSCLAEIMGIRLSIRSCRVGRLISGVNPYSLSLSALRNADTTSSASSLVSISYRRMRFLRPEPSINRSSNPHIRRLCFVEYRLSIMGLFLIAVKNLSVGFDYSTVHICCNVLRKRVKII